MTMRNFLLTVHIVAVAAWVGADLLQFALGPRLQQEPGPVALAWARQQEWLHATYYAAVVVVLLVSGIGLVLEGPYTRSSGFVWVGVGAVVVGGTLGGGVLGSLSKRRVAALEAGDAAQAQSLHRRMRPFELAITAAALVALATMVGKWQA